MADLRTTTCPACGTPRGQTKQDLWGYTLDSCDACGSWYWNGTDTPNYDDVYKSPEYIDAQVRDLQNTKDVAAAYRVHPTYASFFENIGDTSGDHALLDVGCGVGRFLHAAKAAGWSVQGIDVSADAIAIGQRVADFPLSTLSLAELAAQGKSFDAVTAFEVVEHLSQPDQTLREIQRVLRPGGAFFCTVPNRMSPTVVGTRRSDWLPPVHLQFYTRQGMEALFRRVGFEQVRTGLVWGGTWPRLNPLRSASVRQWARHALNRVRGRVKPDPLGIWCMGRIGQR